MRWVKAQQIRHRVSHIFQSMKVDECRRAFACGFGTNRMVASLKTPSVPSLPTKSLGRSKQALLQAHRRDPKRL